MHHQKTVLIKAAARNRRNPITAAPLPQGKRATGR